MAGDTSYYLLFSPEAGKAHVYVAGWALSNFGRCVDCISYAEAGGPHICIAWAWGRARVGWDMQGPGGHVHAPDLSDSISAHQTQNGMSRSAENIPAGQSATRPGMVPAPRPYEGFQQNGFFTTVTWALIQFITWATSADESSTVSSTMAPTTQKPASSHAPSPPDVEQVSPALDPEGQRGKSSGMSLASAPPAHSRGSRATRKIFLPPDMVASADVKPEGSY